MTPSMRAVQTGQAGAVDALFEHEADTEQRRGGRVSAWLLAVERRDEAACVCDGAAGGNHPCCTPFAAAATAWSWSLSSTATEALAHGFEMLRVSRLASLLVLLVPLSPDHPFFCLQSVQAWLLSELRDSQDPV